MRLLLVLLTLYVGSLTYYAEGLMEAVYARRLAWGHVAPCPACIGQLAMLDPVNVGRHAYITRPGQPPAGPFLIVDCAAEKDRARLQRRGLIAEVDYATARRWRILAGPLEDVRIFVLPDRSRRNRAALAE